MNITKEFNRYPYFFVVGLFGFGLNIVATYFMAEILKIWYLVSFILATLITWTTGFILNHTLTFPDDNRSQLFDRYLQFMLTYVLLSLPAFGLVYMGVSVLGINYIAVIISINIVMSIITFLFNKKVIFRSNN